MTGVVSSRRDTGDQPRVDPGRVWGMYGVIALSFIGTVMIALAYAGGRNGVDWPQWLFWPGHVLAYVPIAYRASSRHLSSAREGLVLVLALALNQILIKWMYSPLMLEFPDELQHWRGTVNLIENGTWDTPNLALPIAPSYPALELVGGAIASSTGISAMTAAFLVAALLRLLQVLALYALFERLSSDDRLAAVASVIYVANPHYLFFDGMYIYQTIALPFLIGAVWLVRRWHHGARGVTPWVLLVVFAAVVTVSHHVTSFVLVAALAALALTYLGRRQLRTAWRPALAALIATGMVLAWVRTIATTVGYYFGPVAGELIASVRRFLLFEQEAGEGSPAPPLEVSLADRAFTLASLALLGWLVVSGALMLWRQRGRDRWTVPMIAGAGGLFAMVALRVLVADGAELAGRAATFVYIPVAFVASQRALEWQRRQLRSRARRRWPESFTRTARLGMATVLLIGGLTSGWPPSWGRLPGPFLPSGFERSVEPEWLAAARWTGEGLGPGHRWAADFSGYVLISTMGNQDPVRGVSPLYQGQGVTPATQELVRQQAIHFLAVDLRTSQQLPAAGFYFPDETPTTYTEPLPRAWLEVFDQVERVSRIYDSGNIRLYDLRESAYVY